MSFLVLPKVNCQDTVEVDNNVTRHIEHEMKRDDWDVLILHYLGLDHIGHYQGPNRYSTAFFLNSNCTT